MFRYPFSADSWNLFQVLSLIDIPGPLINNLIIVRCVHSDGQADGPSDIGCTFWGLAPTHIHFNLPVSGNCNVPQIARLYMKDTPVFFLQNLMNYGTYSGERAQSLHYHHETANVSSFFFFFIGRHTDVGVISTHQHYREQAPAVWSETPHVIRRYRDKGPVDLARFNTTQPLHTLHICPRPAFLRLV